MVISSICDSIYPVNPVTKERQLFTLIPESWELSSGKYFQATTVQAKGECRNPAITSVAEKICAQIAPVTDRKLPYTVNVIDSSVLNACCFPGGYMILNRGIIEGIQTAKKDYGLGDIPVEDKIAAVMAHEMVHGAARHGMRGIEFGLFVTGFLFLAVKVMQVALENFADREEDPSKQTLAVAVSEWIDTIYENLGDVVKALWMASFSRANEDQSDKFGMAYLQRAGYDPKAMIWAMEYLGENEPILDTWLNHITDLFRTHHHGKDRANTCRENLKLLESGKLA